MHSIMPVCNSCRVPCQCCTAEGSQCVWAHALIIKWCCTTCTLHIDCGKSGVDLSHHHHARVFDIHVCTFQSASKHNNAAVVSSCSQSMNSRAAECPVLSRSAAANAERAPVGCHLPQVLQAYQPAALWECRQDRHCVGGRHRPPDAARHRPLRCLLICHSPK